MWMLLAALSTPAAQADDSAPSYKHATVTSGLEIKWVRDSAEYAWITTQTYRTAARTVVRQSKRRKDGTWAVVLDVDETVLDNNTYHLERYAYGIGYEDTSWYAWCDRRAAPAIPGAKAFVDTVREAGGKVIYITNRFEVNREATQDNLTALGLFEEGDALCLRDKADPAYTKVARRSDALAGQGRCSTGGPVEVVAYVGDQMSDFPEPGEEKVVWDQQIGVRYFLLPNPSYGRWTRSVTRDLP